MSEAEEHKVSSQESRDSKTDILNRDYTGDDLDSKCFPIFEKLYEELGERYADWIVVIEPETGDYFLGLDDYEVLNRARRKYPRAQFFAYRIGPNPAVDTLC